MNEKFTKYYISHVVKAPPDEGIKYCQSMDVILASPQNQDEFDNLRLLLRNTKYYWENAAISGYRTSDGKWTDTGDGLAYKGNWSAGETNNAKANEHCLFLSSPDVTLNDDPRVGYSYSGQFICEFNSEGLKPFKDDDKGLEESRFIKLLTQESNMKLYLSHKNLKLSWVEKLMCKTFGMNLFTPESKQDIEHVKEMLSIKGFTAIWTGMTEVGADRWYSIVTGESSKASIEVRNYYKGFALMTVDEAMLIDSDRRTKENFMCQKMDSDNNIQTNNAVMVKFNFLANNVFLLFVIHLLHIKM